MSVVTDINTSRRELSEFDAEFTTDGEQVAAEDPVCSITCRLTQWE